MESVIIDRTILPEVIISYIHSEKIKIAEENGNIILSPVKEKPNLNELVGMFSDGKLSTKKFIEQKAIEIELEK
jgi:predicted small integral membrane protein